MDNNTQKITFHKIVRQLLRPIISLAIRKGISANDLFAWIKLLYVEEAEQFKIEGKKQSSSRIAVLTGLNRKEVSELRKINQDHDAVLSHESQKANRALRAVKAWETEEKYHDDHKQTLSLPLYGASPSFESLVKQNCGDITLLSVLNELEQSEFIELNLNRDEVSLKKTNYELQEQQQNWMQDMGQASADLINTAMYNFDRDKNQHRLFWNVSFKNLDEELTQNLQKLIEQDCIAFKRKLTNWVSLEQNLAKNASEKNKIQRVGLGIYYFQD